VPQTSAAATPAPAKAPAPPRAQPIGTPRVQGDDAGGSTVPASEGAPEMPDVAATMEVCLSTSSNTDISVIYLLVAIQIWYYTLIYHYSVF